MYTAKREHGSSPNSNCFNGAWVVRDENGKYIEHANYINDLKDKYENLNILTNKG